MRSKTTSFLSLSFLILLFSFTANTAFASTKSEYKKSLKAWTQKQEVYQREDFYASMTWAATLLSPEFLSAQNDEIARIYRQTDDERSQTSAQRMNKFANATVFFVSFYGYDYKTANLAKKDSIWKLRLEVDGERFEPVRFESMSKPTPFDSQLFPYINPWSYHYYVYFPNVTRANSRQIKLTIDGPFSHGVLAW